MARPVFFQSRTKACVYLRPLFAISLLLLSLHVIFIICTNIGLMHGYVAGDPVVYSQDFAVEIKGGAEHAKQVAQKHGFHYRGPVGTLEDMYLLTHPRLSKRSVEPSTDDHHGALAADASVKWLEQQQVKIRTKRALDDQDLTVEGEQILLPNHFLGKSYRSATKRLRRRGNTANLHAANREDPMAMFLPQFSPSEIPSANKRLVVVGGVDHSAGYAVTDVVGLDTARAGGNFQQREREEKPYFPDPLFSQQWYLNHGAAGGYDMNVVAAWKRGYSGKGVSVTILDDGLQPTHPDIQQNYDPLASLDINGGDDDPTPTDDNNNKHGTRCAGEVAAVAGNDHCGVGVAYNSSIGGVRMLDGDIHDAVEATALSHHPQHIDIYSASWGPNDDGRTVDGPGPLAIRAFEQGIRYGRRGLGSIFVWASGNGGKHEDRCSCDGYTNSIYTLSISSAAEDGGRPWYLEECASTLATTYSSGSRQQRSIVTVDLNTPNNRFQECTERHTGTSASAPLAAGLIAFALEANRNLTWRDMQHIVLLSANPVPLIDPDWRNNSLGRKFSHKFGYGLMDADAMTRLAEKWQTVPAQLNCSTPLDGTHHEITAGKLVLKIKSDPCQQLPNNNASVINYLEHVQARLSINSVRRGNIFVRLTSPRGTISDMLQLRQYDTAADSFRDWPFMSVHFFGEDPRGEWTLEVRDMSYDPLNSLLNSHSSVSEARLVFFGTSADPIQVDLHALGIKMPNNRRDAEIAEAAAVKQKAEAYALLHQSIDAADSIDLREVTQRTTATKDENRNAGTVAASACHITCKTCHTPAQPGACTSCFASSGWLLHAGACIKQCPSGFYPADTSAGAIPTLCKPCMPHCLNCSNNGTCSQCEPKFRPKDDKALECVPDDGSTTYAHREECPHGQFFSHRRTECLPCAVECAECSVAPEHCTKCSSKYPILHEAKCLGQCPAGFFVDSNGTSCLMEGHFKNPQQSNAASVSLSSLSPVNDAENEIALLQSAARKRGEETAQRALRNERDNAVINGVRFHVVSTATRLMYAAGFISIAGLILCCVYGRATGRGIMRQLCYCCYFFADRRRNVLSNKLSGSNSNKSSSLSNQARYRVIRDIDNDDADVDEDDEEEQVEFELTRSSSNRLIQQQQRYRAAEFGRWHADAGAVFQKPDVASGETDDEFDIGGDMLKRSTNIHVSGSKGKA